MFGYIRPCKPQLRICEYDAYKAVYCGLCKQLGHQYGPFSRLTLNFDFTFLALLELACTEQTAPFPSGRCMLNPFKKMPCCGDCHALSFASGVAMIMFYFKVLDNARDGGWKEQMVSAFCMPLVRRAYKLASARFPEAASAVYDTISRQSALEDAQCSSVDEASEPTAKALSAILGLLPNQSIQQRRVMERFGYLLGRFIYLCDALDDLEQDLRQRSYNPFLLSSGVQHPDAEQLARIRQDAKGSLFLTMGEVAKTYELLELSSYKPILDNIIHLGLHGTVAQILSPKENEHG